LAVRGEAADEAAGTISTAHRGGAPDIRNLMQRFPAARQAELRASERDMLQEMMAGHRHVFRERARTLLKQISLFGNALGMPSAPTAKTTDVLDAAQHMDGVLSAIFGNARTDLSKTFIYATLLGGSREPAPRVP
jgi:hypothetical protein